MNTNQDHAGEYADSVKETIEEMMSAYDNAHEEEANEEALEALDSYPLEIVHQIGSPFEVVLTVGGPDARLVHDMRFTSWELEVHWGVDVATRRSSSITAMGEYFLGAYES